jgi:hypothetical protein
LMIFALSHIYLAGRYWRIGRIYSREVIVYD